MKYKNLIYLSLAFIIAAVLVVYFVGNFAQDNDSSTQPQTQSASLTQKNSEGAVTVEVTPKELAPGSQAVFEITFDTHSVELNYDIAEITQLTDDNGNSYKPLSWTGGKGSHHIEGRLTFPEIEKSTKKVTLTIPGIDNKDRVFIWDLQ